ncbi:hypothetical protein MDAP_001889 [Mitosporidium daphniae]|uniref:Uncharacterized protein n=1 Tax=Mitosporidium daphniae TaxID=1485682 RepID=A0A098VRR8_9MICR|nr:uncharacterized protein DI09_338p20 [Mitosporidium daphniae]KGG51509.1 hypothetical protein DI09_338p20 [Mitosporidium daphniae]|eukprot:XP_013237945.1 uncharacterized protein DI09_338p20 [Mitosporidium daphniae]
MKLWTEPFNHIQVPAPSSISSIEYSFLKNLNTSSKCIQNNREDEDSFSAEAVISRLKSEISMFSKGNAALKHAEPPVLPTTTYYLDWFISRDQYSQRSQFTSGDASDILRNYTSSMIHSDAIKQVPILIDYLITLIETSRKKINVLDATLRELILPAGHPQDTSQEEKSDSIIMAHQLISLIDREEKLIDKYGLLRSKLVDIDKLNEKLLRKLWRYRVKTERSRPFHPS